MHFLATVMIFCSALVIIVGGRYSSCVGCIWQVSEQVQAVAAMSNAHSQMSVDTADCHCQVTPLVTDGAVQTERHSMQSEAQTELSIAWRAERETQVVTAVSESSVQASVSVNITECQTDSSMANLLSEEVQACTDVICSDSQTDLSQLDSEAQTEVCFHLLYNYTVMSMFQYFVKMMASVM